MPTCPGNSNAESTYVSFRSASTPHFAHDSYTWIRVYLQITNNSKAYKFDKDPRKGQVIPVCAMNAYECVKVQRHSFGTAELDGGEWSHTPATLPVGEVTSIIINPSTAEVWMIITSLACVFGKECCLGM